MVFSQLNQEDVTSALSISKDSGVNTHAHQGSQNF